MKNIYNIQSWSLEDILTKIKNAPYKPLNGQTKIFYSDKKAKLQKKPKSITPLLIFDKNKIFEKKSQRKFFI